MSVHTKSNRGVRWLRAQFVQRAGATSRDQRRRALQRVLSTGIEARAPMTIRRARSFTGLIYAAAVIAVAGMGCSDDHVLVEPIEIRSENGLLDVRLEVVWEPADTLRYFKLVEANGKGYSVQAFPGPTFRVSRGDSVRIHLANKLPVLPRSDADCIPVGGVDSTYDEYPNCLHGSNTTNLHFHGFHISPKSPADNVLLKIRPGESFQYAFRVPPNQAPGTHWYHPHKHGSVALQVLNGMAGAFIVEGDFDDVPQIARAKERVLVLQETTTDINIANRNGREFHIKPRQVNGQSGPVVIHMRPSEVQRWRLVNASVKMRNNYTLFFEDGPGEEPVVLAIARDGVPMASANYGTVRGRNVIAPGNRIDLLVQAPARPGVYSLNALFAGRWNRRVVKSMIKAAFRRDRSLVKVVVVEDGGGDYVNTLPDSLPPLPPFLQNLGEAEGEEVVIFSDQGRSGDRETPPRFYISKPSEPRGHIDASSWCSLPGQGGSQPAGYYREQFTPGDPFITMPLEATQDWKIINRSVQINHPFHIHVNPFQVLSVFHPNPNDDNASLYHELNYAAQSGNPIWLDTMPLPRAVTTRGDTLSGYAVVRHKFRDFTGDFVMHCHILGHEERGMMQLLRVQ